MDRLTASIVELVETWSLRPLVKALQALRGVNVIAATVLAAELGDLTRFETAPKLMGYLGLVPSEHSSGETTTAGAHHPHRQRPRAAHPRRGGLGLSLPSARRARPSARAARASRRRSGASPGGPRSGSAPATGSSRRAARTRTSTVTAIARELAGFVWAIGREPKLLAH